MNMALWYLGRGSGVTALVLFSLESKLIASCPRLSKNAPYKRPALLNTKQNNQRLAGGDFRWRGRGELRDVS